LFLRFGQPQLIPHLNGWINDPWLQSGHQGFDGVIAFRWQYLTVFLLKVSHHGEWFFSFLNDQHKWNLIIRDSRLQFKRR